MKVYMPEKDDEFLTVKGAVRSILPFVNPKWRVWCPFDREYSAYVRILREHGCEVIFSHIDVMFPATGKTGDFFSLAADPPFKYDAIISNPPYTLKREILEKCGRLGKPFALLMPSNYTLSGSTFDTMSNPQYGVHFIWFRRRWQFYKYNAEKKRFEICVDKFGNKANSPLATIYFCGNGFLHSDAYVNNGNRIDLEAEINGDIFERSGVA